MLRVLTGFSLLFTIAALLSCGSAPASVPEPVLPPTSIPTATQPPTATLEPTPTPPPTITLTVTPTATPGPTAAPTPTIGRGGNGRYTAAVGTHAPTFTLPSGNGPVFDLASYMGKKNVVLVFYRTHT